MPAISSADYIKWVQRTLNRRFGSQGKIPVNGVATEAYRGRVREFQKWLNMAETGQVDEALQDWFVRFNHYDSRYMNWVAWALQKAGILAKNEIRESRVRLAIRTFQGRNGFKADGWVGAKTETALILASGDEPYDGSGSPVGGSVPIPMPLPLPPKDEPWNPKGTYDDYPAQTWIAVGGKGSLSGGRYGRERHILAFFPVSEDVGIFTCDVFASKSPIQMDNGWEVGGGLGLSAGVCVGMVRNLRHPYQLEGFTSQGVDFGLSLGVNTGWFFKALRGPLASLARMVASSGGSFVRNKKAAESAVLVAKNAYNGVDYAYGEDPIQPCIMETPIGVGVEACLYWSVSTYHLRWKKIYAEDGFFGTDIVEAA